MPSVDVAMVRSLRPSAWELVRDAVARSVAQDMAKRDILTDAKDKVTDVKTAFSSWDNCMKASFCKWPVIAIIIVGSLILLAILWCVVRCCCLGMSCCCSCFSCLKCCGNCCGCCDPPGGRKHKYLDEPYSQPHSGPGYRTQAPMQVHHAAPAPQGPPQYAQFDMPQKGGEDSLPHMPSWETAGAKKVMLENNEMEMENLNKPLAQVANRPMNTPSPGPVSPMSMHHDRQYGMLPGSSSGQMSNHSQQGLMSNRQVPGRDLYANGPPGQPGGYNDVDRHSNGFGLDEPYDDMMAAAAVAPARHFDQQPTLPGQQPHDIYGQSPHPGQQLQYDPYQQYQQPQQPSPPPQHPVYEAPGSFAMSNSANSMQNAGYGGSQARAGAVELDPHSSPPPAAQGLNSDQIHEHYAEMPAMPMDRNSVSGGAGAGATAAQKPQSATSPVDNSIPRELTGSTPPEGFGMRRAPTGDGAVPPSPGRPPYGMDAQMRNSPGPGPRPPPGPQMQPPRGPDSPYGRPPRGSPGPGPRGPPGPGPRGYGQPPRSPRDRTYSPAPERPGAGRPPPRQGPPAGERLYTAAPPRRPVPRQNDSYGSANNAGMNPPSRPHPSSNNSYNQTPSPPSITNNAGFDFTSGFARPQ